MEKRPVAFLEPLSQQVSDEPLNGVYILHPCPGSTLPDALTA
jgi:hypothetical protein